MIKKLFTLFTLLTLSIGVGWATDITTTIVSQSNAGSTLNWSNSSFTFSFTDIPNNATIAVESSGSARGLQMGAGVGDFVLESDQSFTDVTKVSIVASTNGTANSNSISVRVGNTDFGERVLPKTNNATYGFEYNKASGTIEITVEDNNKSVYIKSVTVTYGSAQSYTISYGTPTNGSFASGNPISATEGSDVSIATTPDDGYALSAVTVNPSATVTINGNNASFKMPASNVTVNASFSKLYGITVEGGTASPTSAYEGQTVTLTPTTQNGKVIDWENTTVSPATVEINHSDLTFTMPGEAVSVAFAFKDAPSGGTAKYIFNTEAGLQALNIDTDNNVDIAGNIYKVNDISFDATDGTQTPTRVFHNNNGYTELRVYTDATFTISAESGIKITNIEFESEDGSNAANSTNLSVNTGEMRDNSWEGSSSEVVFTASHQVRIYTITVYYTGTSTSNDLYIIGHVNQYVPNDWTYTDGVKMTYDETTQTYSKNIYITGANNTNEIYGWIQLSSALGPKQNLIDNKNLYGSGDLNGGAYWGLSETLDQDVALYKESQTSYRLAPGLYTITADLNHGPSGNQYTNCKIRAHKNTATISFSEESGSELVSGSEVTITSTLAELSGSNSVVIEYSTDGGDTWTAGTTATLPASCSKLKARAYIPGSSLVPSKEGMFLTVEGEANYTVYQTYNVTVADNITGGSVTASPKNNVREGNTVHVTVTPSNNYELTKLIVDGTDVANDVVDGQYTFSMPAHDVAISATFTYNGVATPRTFARIKSTDYLIAGEKYLIVNESAEKALQFNGNSSTASAIEINNNQTTISETDAAVLTLGVSDGEYTFATGSSYVANPSSTDIKLGSTYNTWTVTFDGDNAVIHHSIPSGSGNNSYTDRYVRYKSDNFKAYATNSNYNSSDPVQLYKEVVEAKLAEIEAPSNPTGKTYIVNEPLQIVAVSTVNNRTLVFARDLTGDSVSCPSGYKDFMRFAVTNADDQQIDSWQNNNWVMLDFTGITLPQGISMNVTTFEGVKGVYTDNKNYTIKVDPTAQITCGSAALYTPNVYCPANFYVGTQTGPIVDEVPVKYWFMTPKPMEVCKFTYAMYYFDPDPDNGYPAGFYMQEGDAYALKGGVGVDLTYNSNPQLELTKGASYRFTGVIMKTSTGSKDAAQNHHPQSDDFNTEFTVAATDLDPANGSGDVITGVSEVKTGGEVVSVTYCDLAGRMSQKPFAGVNIIVTRYSDGTVKTTKAIK